MPGVKLLHQQSESNSKPSFIMGHSFRVFGVLCRVGGYYFCVPVCARIPRHDQGDARLGHFGSWIRTIRPGELPSEMIVSESLKNTLPEFLRFGTVATSWRKFMHQNVDPERAVSSRSAA